MITLSWGYGIQTKKEDTLDMVQQVAEAYMYNSKLYNHNSKRSKTMDVMMETLFTKCNREKQHSERVGYLSEKIAIKMHLRKSEVDTIRVAWILHDIGKIGVDETILNKPGSLNDKEWDLMKLHSTKGAEILYNTKEYQEVANIVLFHHESYDGEGYPNRLKGEAIPLGSRIIAVADTFDVLTNQRPYSMPLDKEAALIEIRKCSGIQLDPEIVEIFIKEVIGAYYK